MVATDAQRTTGFTFVADDPDVGWDIIEPYALHESQSYGRWAHQGGMGDATSYTELDDRAALEAVRRWTFKPATRNGQPIVTDVLVPITFNPQP